MQETIASTLEDLQKDSTNLGDLIGTRDGHTYPTDVTDQDIVTALESITSLENIVVDGIYIVEANDAIGTLIFIITYQDKDYTIVVEGFWGTEIKLLGDLINDGKIIEISEFSILVDYFGFDSNTTLASDITKEQVISFVELLNNQAYLLPESAYILTPNDEQGTLQIKIYYKLVDEVWADYDFTVTGFATANP